MTGPSDDREQLEPSPLLLRGINKPVHPPLEYYSGAKRDDLLPHPATLPGLGSLYAERDGSQTHKITNYGSISIWLWKMHTNL